MKAAAKAAAKAKAEARAQLKAQQLAADPLKAKKSEMTQALRNLANLIRDTKKLRLELTTSKGPPRTVAETQESLDKWVETFNAHYQSMDTLLVIPGVTPENFTVMQDTVKAARDEFKLLESFAKTLLPKQTKEKRGNPKAKASAAPSIP